MFPALAEQLPALTFKDAADYVNDKVGLMGSASVRHVQVLDWAFSNNSVSVRLPLRARARRTDAPGEPVEQLDGVVALVLDDVGKLEVQRWSRVLHGDNSVYVTGHQGATVTRDGVTYELLDPQREQREFFNSFSGSALPAQAELVINQDALRRFVARLTTPVVTPVPSASDLEITADPLKDTAPATPQTEHGKPFRLADYPVGEMAKDPTRKDARTSALAHFLNECAEPSRRRKVTETQLAKHLEVVQRTIRNWRNCEGGQDGHDKVVKGLREGPRAIPR